MQRSAQVVGTLAAQEEVTRSTEVPSTVSKICVDLGDRVLESSRANVERAEAVLTDARTNLKPKESSLARVAKLSSAREGPHDRRRHARSCHPSANQIPRYRCLTPASCMSSSAAPV